MKIEVKQEHIDKGDRTSPCSCPVALALKEAGLPDPGVTETQIRLDVMNSWRSVQIPDEAAAFVRAFDAGESVQPFTFDLPLEPTHAN